MLINELSKKTGFSKDTIRYYEKIGLLNPFVNNVNKYKIYNEHSLNRLFLIRQAKDIGFTLNEIKDVIDLWENNLLPKQTKMNLLKEKIELIDEKIEQLNLLKERLKKSFNDVNENCSF